MLQRTCRCELLAFILYLCSLKQQYTSKDKELAGCELLAFILYLCSLKQLKRMNITQQQRCELLAFILYLCSLKQHEMGKTKSHNNLEVVSEKKNPARKSGIFLCYGPFSRFKTVPIADTEYPPTSACSC